MKLERMLAIITYLLNHEKVKAQDLANQFEVSVRTIYRDIDAISQAGIPVTTYQGAEGGIGIIQGYKMDKQMLTPEEIVKIVTALKGLHSIHNDAKTQHLIEKLNYIANQANYLPAGNEIFIDLSPWNHHDQLGQRIQKIKNAISDRKRIEFCYYSNESQVLRTVEPLVIVFKESNWYLYAFCLLRKDFRLFKLRRMTHLLTLNQTYEEREFSLDQIQWNEVFDKSRHTMITALFDPALEHVLLDIFGPNQFVIAEDGRYRIRFHMTLSHWLYGFLLGFGNAIEIVEPVEVRENIKRLSRSIYEVYQRDES